MKIAFKKLFLMYFAIIAHLNFGINVSAHSTANPICSSLPGSFQYYMKNCTLQALSKDALLMLAILWGTIVAHELSHTLTTKVLYGIPCDTYFGMSSMNFRKAESGESSIVSFVGLNTMAHYFPHWSDKVKPTPLKEAIIALAGPIVATILNYLALKNIDGSKYFMAKIMALGGIFGHAGQLYPYHIKTLDNAESDGMRLIKSLKALIKN